MTQDTGTQQWGASTAEHRPLDDHDCRTIPICFARMRQTARAPCRISWAERCDPLHRLPAGAGDSGQGRCGGDTYLHGGAFSRDPEFYASLRTLEVYGEKANKNSVLSLTTSSDFYRYVKQAIPEREQRDRAYHQRGKRMRSPRDSPLGRRGKADAIF